MSATITSPSIIRDIAIAASRVRIAPFANRDGGNNAPTNAEVETSFLSALKMLPEIDNPRLSSVRDGLHDVAMRAGNYAESMADVPAVWPLKDQAIEASANLHTLLADLVMQSTK